MRVEKDLLKDYALSFLGTPYIYGGQGYDGVDCSGYVVEILRAFGAIKSHQDFTAQQLYDKFRSRPVMPMLGALAFFGRGGDNITHVGFCLNKDLMAEAGGGDSNVVNKAEAEARNAFVRIRPIQYRGDLVRVLNPIYWGG